MSRPLIFSLLLVLLSSFNIWGQSNEVAVTFKFEDPSQQYFNVFVPGSFNEWGPNTEGRIFSGAPSQMTYNAAGGYWEKDIVLPIGSTFEYKFHVHNNADGSAFEWFTDPLNSTNNGAPNFNSLVTISDPMFFQLQKGGDANNEIFFQASVFGNSDINQVSFFIGDQELDVTSSYNATERFIDFQSGEVCDESAIYKLTATDTGGKSVSDIYTCGSSLFTTDWAQDAIWYQIFPERFRNGDLTNDPVRSSLEAPQFNGAPRDWEVTPWASDWYSRSDWEQALGNDFYNDAVFLRRYGGDLQGVIDKLDYLEELGINAIYFNPVFWGPSLHKYDVASHHHIDPHFGPDPEGDKALMANENENPATWSWTKADSLFLDLLQQAKAKNIRVIIDGVFNHTGRAFFAFQDLLENQQNSPYADWYDVIVFDDPNTGANEFRYESFFGFESLPEFANDATGNTLVEPVRQYIYDITNRWMDPNGDGDPSDGVDGWRLDAAALVPNGFWSEWNLFVRNINPNAYTVLEEFAPAANLIREGQFSAAMNYQAFLFPMQGFFIIQEDNPATFWSRITNQFSEFDEETRFVMQNLMDSHDSERLPSMLVNNSSGGIIDNPRSDQNYDVRKPNQTERDRQKMVVMFQVGYQGAPMFYYGSESGMWGANDPDDRMPMNWEDIDFEPQVSHPFGRSRPEDDISFDQELFNYYKNAIRLRNNFESLRRGEVESVSIGNVLIYKRVLGEEEVYIAINNNSSSSTAFISDIGNELEPVLYTQGHPDEVIQTFDGNQHSIQLPPYSGAIYAAKGSFAVNYAPEISNVLGEYETQEDVPLQFSLNFLEVEDEDNTFPNDFSLKLIEGDNYTVEGNNVIPDLNFFGELVIKVAVNDGMDDSPIVKIPVRVISVNDAPEIKGATSEFILLQNQSLLININDLIVEDADNELSELTLTVLNGDNYAQSGNEITPLPDFTGTLNIRIQVSDGLNNSEVFNLPIEVSDVTSVDPTSEDNLSIYPVPATDILSFSLDNGLSGMFEVNVMNTAGAILLTQAFNKSLKIHKGQVNVERLKAGLYFLEIKNKDMVERVRFVK